VSLSVIVVPTKASARPWRGILRRRGPCQGLLAGRCLVQPTESGVWSREPVEVDLATVHVASRAGVLIPLSRVQRDGGN